MIRDTLRRSVAQILRKPIRRLAAREHTRPIFIVGSGRSGNTLLRRMLVEEFDLFIPPETYVLGDVVKNFQRIRKLGWRDLVVYVAGSYEYHPEFRHFGIPDLKLFVAQALEHEEANRSLENLLDSLYLHFSRVMGDQSSRWGDKTPYNIYSIDEIAETFPGGKFANIVRDGADVVHSYLAAGIYDSAETAADRWVYACEKAARFERRHPDRMATVRYETLVEDPAPVVAELGRFLGLEHRATPQPLIGFDDVMAIEHLRNVVAPVVTTSVGKGRAALSTLAPLRLKAKMDKTLVELGYPPL